MSQSGRSCSPSTAPRRGGVWLLPTCLLALVFIDGALAQTAVKPGVAGAGVAMRAGMAAAGQNNLAEARRQFTRAVQLAPQVAATHAALGSILLAQGEIAAASSELERAHSLSPDDQGVTINLARAESLAGRYGEALPLFRQALESSPPPALSDDEFIAFTTTLSATGDAAEAETRLASAAQTALVVDALGALYAGTGRLEQARTSFLQAIAADPAMSEAKYHLGAVLIALGRPEEAVVPLQQATAAMPGYEAHLQLGRAYSLLHQDSEALAELHQAAALELKTLGPKALPPDQAYQFALALEASGDAAGSLPFFQMSLTTARSANDVLVNAAIAYVQVGDALSAIPLYQRALEQGPDTPTLREDFGVAYLQQSDLDHALEQFHAGLRLDPQSAHLHYDLGLAYKLKDNLPDAIKELEHSSELDPTLPDPAYTLGILYTQQGREDDARQQLERATALQPDNGEAWAALAGVLKQDHVAEASDALEHAIALEPEQPSLHIQLASLLVRTGDNERAAAERKAAADLSRLAMKHQRATFALKSGKTLLQQGKLPEAITQLTVAVEAEPSAPEGHSLLAEALERQGKSAEAALERKLAGGLARSAPASR